MRFRARLACGKDRSCHYAAFLEFSFENSPILLCALAHAFPLLCRGKDRSCHYVAFLEFSFENSPILLCALAHAFPLLCRGKDRKHGGAGHLGSDG